MTRISSAAIERDRESAKARGQKYIASPQYHDDRLRKLLSRRFIGWDGEGYTDGSGLHHYMLFGCSDGDYVSSRSLSTDACLNLILEVERDNPDAFHGGFAFDYDVNMMLADLPWRHLNMLREFGRTRWEGYRIKHTPGKMFRVSKGGTCATIYDVFGFFHSSYIKALDKYDVGTLEQRARIAAGKDERRNFTYDDIRYVWEYWTEEIGLFPPLMDKIREAAYRAGFYITTWHGPGALASYALRTHGAKKWMSRDVPKEIQIARASAYAGGRFQSWRAGIYDGAIYTADINSAYAYAASQMPRLDNGTWQRRRADEVTSDTIRDFALYYLEYKSPTRPGIPNPLFHRSKAGQLSWPFHTAGWYWGPEAREAVATGNARVIEAWEFHDDGTRPFYWIRDMFASRLALQRMGDPAEKAFKWALAAMYGQFAQRVGWNKKTREAPASHQIEWAGYITSKCRAMIYRAALDVAERGGLISIDTDGVTSTVPFRTEILENGEGEGLGEWKLETFQGILYWQNGIYWTKDSSGNYSSAKARGVPKGKIEFDLAYSTFRGHDWRGNKPPRIELTRERFIGYKQSLGGKQFGKWRTWQREPVKLTFGGAGKSGHAWRLCRECREPSGGLHDLIGLPVLNGRIESEPHKLPWIGPHPPDDFYNVTSRYDDENGLYPLVRDDSL